MKNLTLFILLLFLTIFSNEAADFIIGHSSSNSGRITEEDIANILKCSTRDKNHKFIFQKLPNLRGIKYVKHTDIDAYYPVHVNLENRDESLLPIYIDEVLMISNKEIKIKDNQSIGIIRGSHRGVLAEYKNLKPEFLVNNVKSLIKGLNGGRVNSIVMYRSQLPRSFNLK